MKLLLLHAKHPAPKLYAPVQTIAGWNTTEDFYIIRTGKSRKYKTVIRYDEYFKVFYIIQNEEDGYCYRNTTWTKL